MGEPRQLLSKYRLISDQVEPNELLVILECLNEVLERSVPGAVVEFGCYTGTTSLFLQRMLANYPERQLHVYDSFAGLPAKDLRDKSPAGEQFVPGELKATKKELVCNFKSAGLTLPNIHSGWFSDLNAKDIPLQIAFAFLDGDYYHSIKDSLRLIEKGLSPGAIVAVDDYQSEALPGAAMAVDEWCRKKNCAPLPVHSLAVIRL